MAPQTGSALRDLLGSDPSEADDSDFVKAWESTKGDARNRAKLAKSSPGGSVAKMEFEVTTTEGSVSSVFQKEDGDFVIWGPASVEVVDKERDRITADALQDALPQLLKRSRLSYEHQDQIVGDILDQFKTEEPREVRINGQTYKRDTFPTDVLKLDGIEPALFVAGSLYNDTQKSQEVREMVRKGEVDSYSISGEAVVSEMAVKDGRTFTDILKIDLSAVTLCREGMNQKAKFDVVQKVGDSLTPQRAANLAKQRLSKTMGNNDNDDDVQKFVDALDDTLDDRLPSGDIATKSDVEEMVDERMKADEGSPSEGTSERPDGMSDSPTNQSDEYEGDSDEWGDDPTNDSDKVEETKSDHPSGCMCDDCQSQKSAGYTREELKSLLPDDQFKAIEPMLDDEDQVGGDFDEEPPEEGEPMPDVDPMDEPPQEMVDDEDPMEEMKAKAIDNLDWEKLSESQKQKLAKSGALEKAESGVSTSGGVAKGARPAHAGQTKEDEVAKADNDAVARDPSMRNIYDSDGTPQI